LSERDRELGALVRRAQADERMPSVVAALMRGGEVVWTDAVGLADLETERAATPETQYRIGSITKTFTAAAVFQLHDEGLLDLDDPVGRHVEELTVATPAIRALLSHASGLQREQPGDMWETMVMPSQEELVASLGVAERVIPGSHWHYSNLAFSILGLVVERLRGVPYRQVVNERLLGPVGLSRTTWTPAEPVATPYLVDPFADAVSLEPMLEDGSLGAAGELWSTAVDIARWGAFLGDPDPDVLSAAAAEEMRTVHAMAETDRWLLAWGAGLELVRKGERVWAGHGGAMPGFLAALLFRPEERLSVAVVTNSGARADPDELALALGEKELDSRAEPPREWRPSPPPEDVVPLLGVWWAEGYSFTFSWRNGRLEARLDVRPAWRPPSVFEQVEPDLWRTVSGSERGEWLRVRRDEQGAVDRLNWAGYPFTRGPQPFEPAP
jgi:CubicO group peptidase (beta-lactamase class C family)